MRPRREQRFGGRHRRSRARSRILKPEPRPNIDWRTTLSTSSLGTPSARSSTNDWKMGVDQSSSDCTPPPID